MDDHTDHSLRRTRVALVQDGRCVPMMIRKFLGWHAKVEQ